MPLNPGYGQTPLPHDELTALLPEVVEVLGEPVMRADVYDLEQALQGQLEDELMPAAIEGALPLAELLTDHFLRDLHTRLYGPIWDWAGRWRRLELNIGIAPERIAVEIQESLDTIAYRWEHTDDWSAHELGIATHAETVRIHPFVDGNGRTTRFLADLVFAAAQDPTESRYDWDLDKPRYIELLRAYDGQRDVTALAAFVKRVPIEAID
ncbi:Fic family protein [Mycolicibacterium komossense]|uniref:Fic family protein n=1 Tax=Mycolicibacterium komossense TaxID=1779 RepID=A0ABT3CLS3_9MYCO|nr:Fic family protein [Mycolicibacterium komossense]MCV7230389.1 Fic family protein [Mycolicibacterium komossense]